MNIIEYEKGMKIDAGMIISGMPIGDYHGKKCCEYISSTAVKNALVSYDNYKYWQRKSVFKYAYDFGNVFHAGMESQIENNDYSLWGNVSEIKAKTTSDKWKDAKESEPNTLFIHPDDKKLIESLVEKTIQTASKVNLLANGHSELSFFWEENGLKCKCRPDFFRPDIGICVDFKTCQDSNYGQFKKDIANFGYHVSSAFYVSGILANTGIDLLDQNTGGFIFTAVQKSEPWFVNIYQLDNASMQEGNKKYIEGLQIIKNGPQETDVVEIGIPGWAFTRD